MSLSLSRFRDSLLEIDALLDEDRVEQAQQEVTMLLANLPDDAHICHFCWEPFVEYAELLRHLETCQGIQRNRMKVRKSVDVGQVSGVD